MKRMLKKSLALILALTMVFGAAPLAGLVGLELPSLKDVFADKAEATTCGVLTYEVSNGKVTITDCDSSASGELVIPSSIDGYPVTSIGRHAFEYCTGLTSVTIPDSVTSIGEYMFSGCTKLASVTIPDSVTSIGNYAFYNCTGLTSVTIGNSVTIIGVEAFEYCTGLTSITIPDSVTSIGDCAFYGCTGLTSITVDGNNPNYSSDEYGVLFNKDKTTLIQYPAGNERTEYIIPDSVTSIGYRAFSDCTGLTSITIPDSVTSISDNAFDNCTGLTSVTIGNSVTSIGEDAFSDCTGLTSVTIPDSVTSIGDWAFKYCTGLTSVTIGNGVTIIGDYAFYYCTGLTSVTIPDSVTNIGNGAFYGTSLYNNSAKWENNVLYIGNHLIEAKSGLSGSYSIKDGTKTIADWAFYNCTGLTSVTIPDSVTSIGNGAFEYCKGLTSVTVDGNNPNYSSDEYGALFNKDKTTLIQYPVGNERTEYIIPDSVTSIGYGAFYNCTGLTSITIPDSVTSIGEYAFSNCTSLDTVYYLGSSEEWNAISISRGNGNLKSATIIYAKENGETKKGTVSDEETNVSVEYISNFHEGEVGLSVERTFDGKAFDIISTQLDINSNEIYDIKMTVDGVVTQPNGKVKVKIPIPAGYDPAKTFVYHVNTNTGTVKNMNAVVEGDYLVFETNHFSYYAVVETKDAAPDEPAEQSYKITWNIDGKITEQKYKAGDVITAPQNPVKSGYRFVGWSPAVPATMPSYDLSFTAVFEKIETPSENEITVSIKNPSTTTINYGDAIILHAEFDGTLPDGAYIEWSESNGNFDMSVSADSLTCKISPKSNGKTVFTATVYDKDGNVISSDTQEMTAKAGLWQKIVAFFKKIFGLTKTIPEAFKGIL